jgi:hypothetical protein
MPELVLGPVLRHVGETHATVWVEASRPCEVEVLGHLERTFSVEGHNFALVCVRGLTPRSIVPYEVALDGVRRWPPPDSRLPPSLIRTLGHRGPLRVAFGSCRVALPHRPPYTLPKDHDERGRGPDALHAFAVRLLGQPRSEWPDLLLMLGDQVYADEVSPGTLEFIRQRRDCQGPHGTDVADFEEYHHLYLDSWTDPMVRWLLSTVPTAMIFDDHDVHDDWNTSLAWRQRVRAEHWWDEHIVSALSSYWVYQHLGNLSPAELERDEMYRRVRASDDGGAILREFAARADHEPDSTRWSYTRELGRTRLVVIDSRAARVLDPDRRSMLDDAQWRWLQEQVTGDFDHLLLGTSLPFLLAPGLHDLEAWSEAVCAGAWGRPLERLAESVRERFDLEHWAAFQRSFVRLAELLRETAAGNRGSAPASIILLSGDVHHCYLAEAAFPAGSGTRSAVYQAVCSPFRNELDRHERAVVRAACSRAGSAAGRLLARSARRGQRPIHWRLVHPRPWFENQVAHIELRGRSATAVFEHAIGADETVLVEQLRHELT